MRPPLLRFRDALASENFSHVTNGHPTQRIVRCFNVYKRDNGPSGCLLMASIAQETPGAPGDLGRVSRKRACVRAACAARWRREPR